MNMHVNSISDVSEVNMEYTVDCFFRQMWYDPRLSYANSSWKHLEDITLHYDLVNKVWTPDVFFRNAKYSKSHQITVPNRLIRIYPQGRVLYSQRWVSCRVLCSQMCWTFKSFWIIFSFSDFEIKTFSFFVNISRLTLRLDSPMKLQKFPLDNQTCPLNIGSCKI